MSEVQQQVVSSPVLRLVLVFLKILLPLVEVILKVDVLFLPFKKGCLPSFIALWVVKHIALFIQFVWEAFGEHIDHHW